jgi:hypothetical protein
MFLPQAVTPFSPTKMVAGWAKSREQISEMCRFTTAVWTGCTVAWVKNIPTTATIYISTAKKREYMKFRLEQKNSELYTGVNERCLQTVFSR